MIFPFNCDKIKVTSPYGERDFNGNNFHYGYDIVGIGSDEVTAVCNGKVVVSRIITDKSNLTWQWGNYICIKDSVTGNLHYYCHLKERKVKRGDTVKAGQIIGIMGNTGYSFGAHLHFEVRVGNTPISPFTVLHVPNKIGTYESTIKQDVAELVTAKIISSPQYWEKHANDVDYLPELLHNMAENLRGKK
mgnify:FL=1